MHTLAALIAALSASLHGAIASEPNLQPETLPAERPSPFYHTERDIVYAQRDGSDPGLTSLDVYTPVVQTDAPRPVLVFVHGGGWSIGDKRRVQRKPYWATSNGWVFVSINYRLSPDVMHPEHARDTAAAIAFIRDHAEGWGGDPGNIAIIGHSAGAHLAGIIASEETLLGEYGMSPGDLAGVVLLDGAGYNLPVRMSNLPAFGALARMYRDAFGDDPDLWVLASPTLQAMPGDDLPPLFCVHAGDRKESFREGTDLVAAWIGTGAHATLYHAADKDHGGINRQLGIPGDADTDAIGSFLSTVLGEAATGENDG